MDYLLSVLKFDNNVRNSFKLIRTYLGKYKAHYAFTLRW